MNVWMNELVECLSVLQMYGKVSTIPNVWMENFDKKSFFSRKGRELDEFVLRLSVFVDVEVVCACRPSTRPSIRLFVKHSTLHRLQPLSLTFGLLFGLLFVKGLMAEGLMAEGLMAYSS